MDKIKSIKHMIKKNGVYYTPEKIAIHMKQYFPDDIDEIYDPTCGDGNLLAVFGDDVKKYGQDIDSDEVEKCKKRLKNFEGYAGDTIKDPKFKDKKFKYIISNPPFSIKWEPEKLDIFEDCDVLPPKNKADYAFVFHILHHLTNDGIAVMLLYPSTMTRSGNEREIRKYLLKHNYIDIVEDLDGKDFDDTYTNVTLLVLKKNRKTDKIKIIHNNVIKEIDRNYFLNDDNKINPSIICIDENNIIPTEEDFKKTVADYLAWKVSTLIRGE